MSWVGLGWVLGCGVVLFIDAVYIVVITRLLVVCILGVLGWLGLGYGLVFGFDLGGWCLGMGFWVGILWFCALDGVGII